MLLIVAKCANSAALTEVADFGPFSYILEFHTQLWIKRVPLVVHCRIERQHGRSGKMCSSAKPVVCGEGPHSKQRNLHLEVGRDVKTDGHQERQNFVQPTLFHP